ncbi:sensor domain-containing diguanylate cyclase [Xanthobacter sp. V3C-3]|uniref:sensor domain-containing diguanylate cyclase n=1 Tax=Xanthobacter lutulentifluminis TaxID=3119935 RepID=UPI003726F9D1
MDLPERRWGKTLLVRLVTATMIVAILGLQSVELWRSHTQLWQDGERDANNVLQTLSTAIERNLYLLDLSLKGAQEVLAMPELMALDPVARNRILFDRAASASYLGTMLVLDAEGRIQYEAGRLTPRQGNFSDRDYFSALREPGQETYISAPFESRLSNGDLSIALSRRLPGREGQFAGVVVAAMRIAYFRALFDSVRLPTGSILSLLRTDGMVILREPSTDGHGNTGIRIDTSPSVIEMVSGPASSLVTRSPLDGIERLYVSRRIGAFPLVMTVGWSLPSLFAEWRQRAIITATLTLCVCLLLALTVGALRRALDRSRDMEQQLESMATTDQLTGLPNRRAIDAQLASELRRARRDAMPLALLMVDIDHFKRVNDTYGHAAGDVALRAVAGRIADMLHRAGDFAGRFGGEEFVVLLPATTLEGARITAERIRADIERAMIDTGEAKIRLTASVGVAVSVATDTPTDLLSRADSALYAAKGTGRNRVSVESLAA